MHILHLHLPSASRHQELQFLVNKLYFDYEVKEFNKTGDIYYLLKVVNDIIKYSDISITEITNNTGLSRPTIYNIINKHNIPKLDTISLLLKELGYRICIEPISRLV